MGSSHRHPHFLRRHFSRQHLSYSLPVVGGVDEGGWAPLEGDEGHAAINHTGLVRGSGQMVQYS